MQTTTNRHFLGHAKRSGQGLTEYIILLGLIALVCFVVIKTVGGNVKETWDNAQTKTATLKAEVAK